uniref:Aquaporin-3 n=1 Tax=Romanomermis culicivorax TaxID=13658 RepID=A0A915KZU1_ROMCU
GHLNPAVSFSFAVAGGFPWSKFFLYSIAQILGAFFGSALTWIIYYDALNTFDGGHRNLLGQNGTADMFATYPQSFLSTSNGLANEIFATCLLMMCVMAIIDKENMALPTYLLPLMVGLTIILINCSFCYNSGCAMNPARDFGPRLFTAVAGWGLEPF